MSRKYRLLDLFCGVGGCSMGYHRAGFEVVGVDTRHQKNYPFEFIQADAFEILNDARFINQFDVIHASPVCKGYGKVKTLSKNAPNQIPKVRELLLASGKSYVIENVPGAPLQNCVELCGSMFGLKVFRHRLFECNPRIWFPPFACSCEHGNTGYSFASGAKTLTVMGHNYQLEDAKVAMGIDWATNRETEMSLAIPPAYTEWIGKQLIEKI